MNVDTAHFYAIVMLMEFRILKLATKEYYMSIRKLPNVFLSEYDGVNNNQRGRIEKT